MFIFINSLNSPVYNYQHSIMTVINNCNSLLTHCLNDNTCNTLIHYKVYFNPNLDYILCISKHKLMPDVAATVCMDITGFVGYVFVVFHCFPDTTTCW